MPEFSSFKRDIRYKMEILAFVKKMESENDLNKSDKRYSKSSLSVFKTIEEDVIRLCVFDNPSASLNELALNIAITVDGTYDSVLKALKNRFKEPSKPLIYSTRAIVYPPRFIDKIYTPGTDEPYYCFYRLAKSDNNKYNALKRNVLRLHRNLLKHVDVCW